MIPKLDKDATENYRTVCLMNKYASILKIFAKIMQECLKKIIHHDQFGFNPEIYGYFNIQISINVVQHISRLKNRKKK